MSLTIRQIAEAAGVSKAAVSYVINGRPGVSDDTRRRILEIMESTGFRPNAVAQGLARQRTGTLGLVIPDISDMFYADIIRAVEEVASERDLTLNLCTTRSDPNKERDVVDAMASGRVDALLMMTYHLDATYIQGLKQRKTPFVHLGDSAADESLYCVRVDNVQAGTLATEHLLELGHRRIAFIHGSKGSRDTWSRFHGYKQSLEQRGIAIDDKLVIDGHFRRDGGYLATQQLLQLDHPPTAIVAANDQMAIGAIGAAADAGLKVPRDLSIVGVDDIEAAKVIDPPLTTVRQPTYEMGRLGALLLMDLLNGKQPRERTLTLATQLVQRKSTEVIHPTT